MTELIKAIGGLWKVGLCIAVPLTVFFLRDPISKCLLKITRIKRGKTEIELAEEKTGQRAPQEVLGTSEPVPQEADECSVAKPQDDEDRSIQMQLVNALMHREDEKAKKIVEDEIQQDPSKEREWKVFYNIALCQLRKDPGAAQELESFRGDAPYGGLEQSILNALAWFYRDTGQLPKAIECYRDAASAAEEPTDKASALVGEAKALHGDGKGQNAIGGLVKAIAHMTDEKALALLYRGLAEIYENDDRQLERSLALEKAAEYDATNTKTIFAAAYAESKSNLPFLALNNYIRELSLCEEDSMARNNYAVLLSKFGLPTSAVEQYKRAMKDGNTLSAANIAHLYLEKGFAEEAEAILQQARKTENYHANVDHTLGRLRTVSKTEAEKLASIRKWAAKYQRFTGSLVEAMLLPNESGISFEGDWRAEDGQELEFVLQQDTSMAAEWGKKGSRQKISGRQVNRAAQLKLYKEAAGWLLPDVPKYGSPRDALAILSRDGSTVEILTTGTEDPCYILLAKVKSGGPEQPDGTDG